MSKAEILSELPKLPPQDRAEIQAKLDELAGDDWVDSDDPLTDAEKALIENRIEAHEKDPTTAISLQELEARLRSRDR